MNDMNQMIPPADASSRTTVRVTCAPGLVTYLIEELEGLGMAVEESWMTGAVVQASLTECMRLNLCLRTANAVLYELREFRCDSPTDLYDAARAIAWETYIPVDGYLSVVSHVDHASIDNSMFPNLKLKDAIVDRFMDVCRRRPDSGPDRHRVVVNLFWQGRTARLFLNTSGRKLADRTYRKMPHVAPMQETLAAAVVLATGYDGTQPLVLPMCGSGTLAIEAALIGTGRAPGMVRDNYGLQHLRTYDADAWRAERRALRKEAKDLPQPIRATDIDPKAIEAARQNARTAGVEHLVELAVCDIDDSPPPPEGGLLIVNPGYGKRLSDATELQPLYRRIGDFLKQHCAGSRGFVFTGNVDLAKHIGLRTSRRQTFYNADIECRLLEYEVYSGSRKRRGSDDGESGGDSSEHDAR